MTEHAQNLVCIVGFSLSGLCFVAAWVQVWWWGRD